MDTSNFEIQKLQEKYDFITELSECHLSLQEINEQFYNVYAPITIYEAQILDYYTQGHNGRYWVTAYDFPKEDEIILIDDIRHIARNVGIFTFDLICLCEHHGTERNIMGLNENL